MRNRMLTVAALLIAAASAGAAAQQNAGPPGPGGRGGRGGRGGPGGGARCMATADSLTDAQKQQVHQITAAFTTAHSAQLDSARAIMEQARTARQSGASQDDIRAIMESGRAIDQELAPARKQYTQDVRALLTPDQVSAGCIPPPPGGPPGGRRGGPPPGKPGR